MSTEWHHRGEAESIAAVVTEMSKSGRSINALDVEHSLSQVTYAPSPPPDAQQQVSRILLSKLRLSQYCTSKVSLAPSIKKLLWHNRHLLSAHSSYIVSIVHCINWQSPEAGAEATEIVDLLRKNLEAGPRLRCCQGPNKQEINNVMCSSSCHTAIGALDAMHILLLRTPSHQVMELCTEVLLEQDESVIGCWIPVLLRLVLSLQNLPRYWHLLEPNDRAPADWIGDDDKMTLYS